MEEPGLEPTLIEPNTEFEIELPWPRGRTAREGDPITIASQASTEIYDIISVTPDPEESKNWATLRLRSRHRGQQRVF